MTGIYKIENKINGKIYIGQSTNIHTRFTKHRNSAFNSNEADYDSYLYRAIRKYGLDNFDFSIIEECSIAELNDREIYWIAHFQSFEYGYNRTRGGQRGEPRKLTLECYDAIIDLLQHTILTQTEIAHKFNVDQSMISYINNGTYWKRDNLSYPIRPRYSQHGKNLQQKQSIIQSPKTVRTNPNKPDREMLKSLIRSTTFVELGNRFGVTDNAVRKWCDSYGLPSKKKDIKQYTNSEWLDI